MATSYLRVYLIALLGVVLAFSVACADIEADEASSYNRFTKDGTIKIESEPSGVDVYLVEPGNETFIGKTPVVYKVEASGLPYAFRLSCDGYYDRRVDARPLPHHRDVTRSVVLIPDPLYHQWEAEESTTANLGTIPESRNFNYEETIGPPGFYRSRRPANED